MCNMETIEKYYRIKEMHSDAVILFRAGDFYEAYETDALLLADMLGLVLTIRKAMTVCAFPHQALDTYLPKIIRNGKRVCIAENI